MRKVKYIGIDFGSSTTSVVGFVEDGKDNTRPVVFSRTTNSSVYPCVMGKGEKNEDLFFEAAYGDKSKEVISNLKESLLARNGEENCHKFLLEVIKRASTKEHEEGMSKEAYDFTSVESVCFGHPSYFESTALRSYCEKMQKILGDIFDGKPEIIGLPEPVLAAQAYYNYRDEKKSIFKEGDTILALDFGGYTMDVALMQVSLSKKDKKLRLSAIKEAVSFQLIKIGKVLTLDLCAVINHDNDAPFDFEVDKAKCELFREGDYKNKKVLGTTTGKEAKDFCLVYDTDGKTDGGGRTLIGFTGKKNSIDINRIFERLGTAIQEHLTKNSIKEHSINYVLFTGGTAKMTPLREYIINALNEWLDNTANKDSLVLMMDDFIGKDISDEDKNLPLDWAGGTYTCHLSSNTAVALGACWAAKNGFKIQKELFKAPNDEIEKLKKENEKLKRANGVLFGKNNMQAEEILRLKKKNEALEKELEALRNKKSN